MFLVSTVEIEGLFSRCLLGVEAQRVVLGLVPESSESWSWFWKSQYSLFNRSTIFRCRTAAV